MQTGRPWVRAKMASSLDGRSGLSNGISQWITGASARQDGHRWRARACAIATGSGTVRHDNPRLTVRDVATILPLRQPLRIVFDHLGEIRADTHVLRDGALIYCASKKPHGLGADVEIVSLPDTEHPGKIDLSKAMADIGSRGINELHLEAGARLLGPMIHQGLIDEILMYVAPKLLGRDARELFSIPEPVKLDDAIRFDFFDVRLIDDDVRMILRKP
jgi:diaminohydroxyphosphoribosylaminopyrimidine deaminase / 5-amino-6-(5-phosphoribosylamino)uracil reductase